MTLCQPPEKDAKTPLQAWVSRKGLTARQFTRLLPKTMHHKYIVYVIAGTKIPSVPLAKMIEQATNGEVKAIDMLKL